MEETKMTLNAEDVAAAEQVVQDSQQPNTIDPQETPPLPGTKKPSQRKVTTKVETPIEKLLTNYRQRYPNNKVFHVTSDMQVFLEGDRNMAVLHQSTLKSGELTTV